MEKYLVSKAPYLRSYDHEQNTKTIMRDLLIALSPTTAFALYKNVIYVLINHTYTTVYQAIYPLITLIIGPLFSVVLEALSLLIMKKDIKNFKDLMEELKVGFGLLPGLFIVLTAPTYTPLWILLIGIAVGEIVGKMLFGGFGQNIFNPALVGRAFLAFSFPDQMSKSYFSAYEIGIDAYAGATPLTAYSSLTSGGVSYQNVVTAYGGFWNYFVGMIPGSFAETSTLAILIGFAYLVIRRVIDWKVPTIYVGTVFIITMFIGFRMGQGLWYPLWNILSGGLMFGAVFMATEPVTMPKTELGRTMTAFMLGALTVLFRQIGTLPEGVATAIITMNVFGLIIDRYCIKMRINGKLDKKEVPGLCIFIGIFLLISAYDIIFGIK